MQRALMDEAIRSLSCFEGVNFLDVLETPLKYFCSKLGDFFEEYKTIENLIEKNRFDLIVLDSLAPMYTPNTMITDIARKKNTPYVCWKHGGFGLYKSFEGSDMGDFLFADYYLARGEADKNAIAAYHPACSIGASCYEKLPQRFKRNSLIPSVAGAPFLERKFNGYARPHNQRKKIVFFLGEFWIHNQYYMGGNTPYTFFQKWDEVVKIIRTLIPHQEKYEIIIKEYPNNFRTEKVKEILRENVGLRLSVKSNECSSWDLLKICDLGIFTWDSSTLYEAAYTDIDQFLFDDSELTDEAKKIIKNTFYFSDTIDAFCEQLHGYLTEGQFYQKQKAEFREKYLDFSHRSTRAERVAEIFKEIIAGRQKN